jgi:hypothetical protein
MFDTIRHPDLTEGQVPVILTQMDADGGRVVEVSRAERSEPLGERRRSVLRLRTSQRTLSPPLRTEDELI